MDTNLLVPFVDIAGHLGTSPAHIRQWAARLKLPVGEDWAGRQGIEHSGASKLIAAYTEAGRESAELHRDFQLYEEDWQRRRHAAGEQAFSDFISKSVEQQRVSVPSPDYAYYGGADRLAAPIGSSTYTSANQAAELARQAFEKNEPRLDFDQFAKRWRKGRK
jgi:hypothetical protein